MELEELKKIGNSIGFFKVEELNIDKIKLLPEVRQMCSTDKCHMYGRNWSCPPACGTLEECAADISGYKKGIIVQTKGEALVPYIFSAETMGEDIDRILTAYRSADYGA